VATISEKLFFFGSGNRKIYGREVPKRVGGMVLLPLVGAVRMDLVCGYDPGKNFERVPLL